MCGIVGLFLKDKELEPKLGEMLTQMLTTMSDRGPDSAGIAIYGRGKHGKAKLTVQSDQPDQDLGDLAPELGQAIGTEVGIRRVDTHAGTGIGSRKGACRTEGGSRIASRHKGDVRR